MRSFMFIAVVVAAIIVLVLSMKRSTTVPADVKNTLGDSVQTMQQIPDAVRAQVTRDMETAAQRQKEALDLIEK